MYVVTVAPGSDLDGAAVGGLDATVAAVRSGGVETLAHDRTLEPGDEVYAVGRPEPYRRVEARSRPPDAGDGPDAQSS